MEIKFDASEKKNIAKKVAAGVYGFYGFGITKRVLDFVLPPKRNIYMLANNLVSLLVAAKVYNEMIEGIEKMEKEKEAASKGEPCECEEEDTPLNSEASEPKTESWDTYI